MSSSWNPLDMMISFMMYVSLTHPSSLACGCRAIEFPQHAQVAKCADQEKTLAIMTTAMLPRAVREGRRSMYGRIWMESHPTGRTFAR
jgi:hypothetical protein